MPSHRIEYSKKDTLLKNFLTSETEIPISNIVELAIEYYVTFGKYMELGKVTADENTIDETSKTLYFPKDSVAQRYLEEQKKNRIGCKKTIARIIESGLKIGEENRILTKKEYLVLKQMVNTSNFAETIEPQAHSNPLFQYRTEKQEVQDQKKVVTERKRKEEEKVEIAPSGKKGNLSFADGFIVGLNDFEV